jgi:serine/threonine protein kinase/tetratricopeptide (TPR) repeat protein
MAETPKGSRDQQSSTSNIETQSRIEPESTKSGQNPREASSPLSESNSAMIGGYRIIRKLGAGGMGIVYEAEQQHPKRLVALKVIRGGRFVDDSHIKLFEREAQALARLKHPAIAAIYETGRTSDGQHFFAMELVRGETLKEYLEKTSSSGPLSPPQLRERLAIFHKIADAVTYAHQRGVIHRDLKPANIIVLRELESSTSESGLETPGIKILDFGLARITETDLAVATIGTEIGAIQGTLPYMSPEQVRGNPDEIDVRSDVYSLGVILYEMIARRRPYDVQDAMLHEAVRVICETPPAPLSKSWSGTKKLDRDIETIVEKALEKPVARRYQSVSALGDDVSRFLTGQPILARPPSAAYQIQKLIARHKVGFGFAGTMVVLLAAFAVVMSIQAERIARARDRANREAQISKQVSDFMRSLFQAPDPFRGKGKEVTAREMLDEGSARVTTELKDQPEVQAEIMLLMATSYYGLGSLDKAAQLAQTALAIGRRQFGEENATVSDALNILGAINQEQGNLINAEKSFEESLQIRRRLFGPDHTLVAEDISDLAGVSLDKGDWKKAVEGYNKALAIYRKALGNESAEVATVAGNLAIVLKNQRKFAEATPLYQEALSIRRRILDPNHPLIASSLTNLAMLYLEVKDYGEAEKLLQEALAIDRKALGETHREVGRVLSCLGRLYLDWDRLPESADYYGQSLAVDTIILGEDNPELGRSLQNLGAVFTEQKKFAEAEECLRKAVSLKTLQFGPNHWEVATAKNYLGACLTGQKKYKEAEPLLSASYSIIKNQFGVQHPRTQRAGSRLIAFYEILGKKDKADKIGMEIGISK